MRTPPAGALVNIPPWDGTPREVVEVWTVRKGTRVATCHFGTHPKGGEARLTIDGEWQRGSVAVNGRTLLDLALDWKLQFEEKGWSSNER